MADAKVSNAPREDDSDEAKSEARSILLEDQTSFIDEKPRNGKQFGDGRKVTNQDFVGAMSPDTDPDVTPPRPTGNSRTRARRERG